MSEILESTWSINQEVVMHPEIISELEKIPSFLGMILVMPSNPAKITEKINEYRKLKAANDEDKLQSLHALL